MRLTRRQIGQLAASLGGLAAVGGLRAQPGSAVLPPRQHLVLRNAYVLTMDAAVGDLPAADVEIRDGTIAAVGEALAAPGAETIDASDMLLLPGLVETHWHIWTTLLRSMAADRGYFPVSRGIGSFYLPGDMAAATRLALAEAVHSGITFVHDWCHNVRDPDYAEASLAAIAESGLRARFSYGTPTGHPNDETIDHAHLESLAEDWDSHSAEGRIRLGLAWRGVGSAASRADRDLADALRLPVSVHVNNFQSSAGGIAAIAEAGLLGPTVQLIHAIWSSEAEIAAVAASGASLSLSPYTELRIGFGMPMTGEYLAAGVPVGLSVDTTTLSGNADMFAIMKVIQNVENARALDEFALPARRVLELATIEGARSIGMEGEIGSVTPGKRADLIAIDTRQVNLALVTDLANLVVEAAQPANVDTVIVDGRILKRGGALTAVDVGAVVDEARAAQAALLARAG
ncbi:MAG TPA: amidohydrolase family protein [Gammaproteobacteria bacterium]|nr:amidohydrolase family protein [Gammaproteobacteria bacterium]